MSDFDKEKEREKLRKKFEQEEERRETTQQMSELLLKGATMLNVHCADCAAPIFRHNGEEFCPTCQRPVEELTTAGPGDLTGPGGPTPPEGAQDVPEEAVDAADVADAPEAAETTDGDTPAEIDVETPSPEDVETTAEAGTGAESDAEPEPEAASEPEPEPQPEPTPAEQPAADATSTEQPSPAVSAGQQAGSPRSSEADAVESLASAITRLSERAAAAEDPRQAKELLAAANEAADVLQQLRD